MEDKIRDKVIKNICKFNYNLGTHKTEGTGFLCKVNYTNNENDIMPVLITCHHLLKDAFNAKINSLRFLHYLKGKENIVNLELNGRRIIYINEALDTVIIEIKEEDNLDIFDFLSIDNSVNIINPILINKKVYLLHYPKTFKDVHITQGHITDILYNYEEKNGKYSYFSFLTDYSSFKGSSGSPVLNYNNNYVIGLHEGGINSANNEKNDDENEEKNDDEYDEKK